MNSNQLFFSWVEYLEGSNQKAFCDKTSISEVTVSRIKNEVQKPSKGTIKRLQDVYGISVQDYQDGVEKYKRKKELKEKADIHKSNNHLDSEKASIVYPLSGIKSSFSRSKNIGYRWDRQFEKNPKDFFYIYVDTNDSVIDFGELVCVCITEKPEENDIVLIYDSKQKSSNLIYYKVSQKNQLIHGVVVN